MRAAVYARKSTDDSDRNEENKSVTRQVEHARAYAEAKGWTVDVEHVYVDDGISGAEFKNRPSLIRMLNALKRFDVIVMSELSRIGRDQIQTGQCLANIEGASVAVEFYLTGERLKFDTAVDRFITNAVSFAAELEREKASQRSRDALERKARQGFNTGGVTFGYDNVPVHLINGRGESVKAHTDYRINEAQAAALRGIFTMYAAGYGHTAIAKAMNGDPRYAAQNLKYFGGRTPAAPRSGTGTWAPSSIREMLYNERYTGKVPFGEFRKVYRGGTKKLVRSGPPTCSERPDLRIVTDELWATVKARLSAMKATYARDNNGRLWGRPQTGRESQYLLSGLACCACCGGSMIATKTAHGSGSTRRLVPHYQCSANNRRGTTVCTNNQRIRMDTLDTQVLAAVTAAVLTPANVRYVIDRALAMAQERIRREPKIGERMEAEIREERRGLDNLIAAIAAGNAPPSIMEEIRRREANIRRLEQGLAGTPRTIELNPQGLRALEAIMIERMGIFRDVLQADPPKARQALRKLLHGPIRCIPLIEGGKRSYAIGGQTRLGALLTTTSEKLATPRGFEPRLPP